MENAQVTQVTPITQQEAALNRVSYCDICNDDHGPIIQLPIDQAHDLLAEFVASAGLVQDAGDDPRKMSMEEFAHRIGWSRKTLYNWMAADPDWDAKVYAAIRRVFGPKRVGRILRGVYTQAAMGKLPQAELLLRNFWPDYKAPKEEKEHTFTGLGDLYTAHAKSQNTGSEVINADEGEVTDYARLVDGQ